MPFALLLASLLALSPPAARAAEPDPTCKLVLMMEGPMDSAGHTFLRLDECAGKGKQAMIQLEGDQAGATRHKLSASKWKASLERISKEFDQLERTPEEQSVR